MDAFIAGLCSSLTSASFWSVVGSVVPFLAISILFALGYGLLNRILEGYNYAQQNPKWSDEEIRNYKWHDWEP